MSNVHSRTQKVMAALVALVMVLGFCLSSVPVHAADGVTLAFAVDKQKVHPGDEVTLSLNMSGAFMGGLQGIVTYDKEQLEYVEGSAAFSAGFESGAMIKLINPDDARGINLSYIHIDGYTPDGSSIFTAKFKVKDNATGDIAFGFENGKIVDTASTEVPLTLSTDGATLTVSVEMTGISLDKTSLDLTKGSTETLHVTYIPENTTDDKTVTWTSSDESVATVADGVVTAVGKGNATITATCGAFSATCDVNVTVPLTDIQVEDASVLKGQSVALTVSPVPADATLGTVAWTSSDESVATVDENGVVTGVTAGTATITATCGEFSDTCTVTVTEIPLESIALDVTAATLNKGDSKTLTVLYNPDDTTDSKDVTWSTSDKKVATVKNGKVTAVAAGTATITAEVNGKTAECVVTVVVPLESITLNETTLNLAKSETAELKVTFNPEDTTADKTVNWTASDETVATVDANGVVTAVGAGSTKVVAECNGKVAECVVNVNVPMTGISMKESVELKKGQTETLTVSFLPADTTDAKDVTWKTSDDSVATVEDGVITAVAPGTATVTATCGKLKATCEVTVTTIPLESIALNKEETTLIKGETEAMSVIITPADTTDDVTATWTSSDESVATVDENGVITAVKAGTATVTATVGDKSASVKVTVIEIPIDSLTMSDASATISVGGTKQLSVEILPENTTDDKTVTWASANADVATVDANGLVTGVKAGTTKVTATVGDLTVTCVVVVEATPVPGEDPSTSSDSSDPSSTNSGTSSTSSSTSSQGKSSGVKTGDTTPLVAFAGLMLAAGAVGVCVYRKKTKSK